MSGWDSSYSIGAICWSSKYGGIIGFIYLPFVVSNSERGFLN